MIMDNNYYLNINKNTWYEDVPRQIANKSTKLWLGKGILFESEKKELLDDWNKFYESDYIYLKLAKFGIQNSLLGRCVLLWILNKDGSITLTVPTPSFMNRVAKINEQEQSAELFYTNNQADNQSLTWVTITSKEIHVEIFNDMNEETILGTVHSKNKPNLSPKTTYTFNNPFGFLPIVEVTNIPNPLLFGQSTTLNGFPDCMPVYQLINDLNENTKQKRKERVLNQTRFFGKLSNEKLLELMIGNTDISEYVKDSFMEVATAGYENGGAGGINFIQGNPKFSEYWNDYNGIKKQIFNGAGYDYDEFGNKEYTNKTESLFNNKNDMETTEFKITHYKQYLYRMFDLWVIYKGHWDGKGERPYSFDFIPIAMTDQMQENELINSRLANGTLSQVEAISIYDKVNKLVAESKFNAIIEEAKKYELNTNTEDKNDKDSKEPKSKVEIKE